MSVFTKQESPAPPGGEESTTAAAETPTTELVERALVTLAPDAEPPEHAATDRYGNPIIDSSTLIYEIGKGKIEILTELFRTKFTFPPTKVGCMCLTRGPLPIFKLIGNLHFRGIKRYGRGGGSSTTDSASTVCPPCNCNDCFTTSGPGADEDKRKKPC